MRVEAGQRWEGGEVLSCLPAKFPTTNDSDVVLHVIAGLSNGGAEAALVRLVKATDGRFRHIVVSLTDDGVHGNALRAAGIEVITLDMPRGRVTVSGLIRLWRVIGSKRPGVVQTWMYHADLLGGLAAKLAGVARIAWGIRHSNLDPAVNKRSTLWVMRACAWLSRWVPDVIVSCSGRASEVHIAAGYAPAKFKTIPNGYDLSALKPDAAAGAQWRTGRGLVKETPWIGCVARWDGQKDHANLFAALAALRATLAFRCALVGPGMDAKNADLADLLEQHGVGDLVYLAGPTAEVPAVMNALDLHVLPSACGEAFPNVVAEALACGTPCVVTDVGDAAYIVGEAGWVVPPCNSVALAEAIRSAMNERGTSAWAQRKRLGRERVEALFSIERMAAAYEAVWAGR